MASSGRGSDRNRPRQQAGPGRSRPRTRRSTPSRAGRGVPPGSPAGGVQGPRRPRLTGRSAIVLVVLAVLFVSYATSLRAWLEQRAHINELEEQIAQSRHAVAELREEKRRWRDEAYVEAQARERFGWVFPGEIGYRVIGEDGEPLDVSSELSDPAALGRDPDAEWWSTTWGSLRVAGEQSAATHRPTPPADRLGPPVKKRDRGRDGRGAGRDR